MRAAAAALSAGFVARSMGFGLEPNQSAGRTDARDAAFPVSGPLDGVAPEPPGAGEADVIAAGDAGAAPDGGGGGVGEHAPARRTTTAKVRTRRRRPTARPSTPRSGPNDRPRSGAGGRENRWRRGW